MKTIENNYEYITFNDGNDIFDVIKRNITGIKTNPHPTKNYCAIHCANSDSKYPGSAIIVLKPVEEWSLSTDPDTKLTDVLEIRKILIEYITTK